MCRVQLASPTSKRLLRVFHFIPQTFIYQTFLIHFAFAGWLRRVCETIYRCIDCTFGQAEVTFEIAAAAAK